MVKTYELNLNSPYFQNRPAHHYHIYKWQHVLLQTEHSANINSHDADIQCITLQIKAQKPEGIMSIIRK
jgi:hypothetical protein